jgi:multidrug transporter EmrE-like cation transporter
LKPRILFGFLLLLAFDTMAQVATKLAGERVGVAEILTWLERVVREPLVYLVLVCNLGALITYVSLLKRAPVGPAYAAAHGHLVTVVLISVLFFGEWLSLSQAVGAVAILAGIAVLATTETGR